ncbi:MAG: polynucleotide adenylyltransferase PcnB, partial [Spirochaetaceae bacterium]
AHARISRGSPVRIRYSTAEDGTPVQQAYIYTRDEHGIDRNRVEVEALKVLRRLRSSGHNAYVVGGAVRDLVLGRNPKDFDIATDAAPGRIRKLFRNSRIIGKRFRLVHIFFHEKIVEVSTFRAEESGGFNNVYGAIEEDVKRRDFTMNALYFDPDEGLILDYVGGYDDINEGRLKPVIPIDRIFTEDPVRMIRAVKYAETGGFKMDGRLRRQIKRNSALLGTCPDSRLTEELFKILASGSAGPIFRQLYQFGLLPYMLPSVSYFLQRRRFTEFQRRFFESLVHLDERRNAGEEIGRDIDIAHLTADFLFLVSSPGQEQRIPFREAFTEMKQFIRPASPPNKDVERALVYLLRKRKKYRKAGHI